MMALSNEITSIRDANRMSRGKIRGMTAPAATVSVIVPTYHEAANLEVLVTRVFAALQGAGLAAELIVVDDNSNDGTVDTIARLAREYPVRLVVRTTNRGLSSAVLHGFAEARSDRLVVMDADLQHPPEKIPELLRCLDRGDCDFVIASRYIAGAGVEDRWPMHRRWVSQVATLLARPLAPLSDPMSGFFALRRETWKRATHLNPVGYKIALELFVKCGCRHPVEVPIRFAVRHAGKSKLSAREQWRYLRHLGRLYRFRYPLASATILVLVMLLVSAIVWLAVK